LRAGIPALCLLTAVTLPLAGCGSGGGLARTFGLTRDAPDEFTVTTRAPLSMPPDFAVRPPRPGAPRPQEQSERKQAEEALVPQAALESPQSGGSAGQAALVQSAGPAVSDDVRQGVDAESRANREANDRFIDRLLFWRTPEPPGIAVDPAKEAKRLRENAALGQNPDAGDTPIIQPHKKGWLEGLF